MPKSREQNPESVPAGTNEIVSDYVKEASEQGGSWETAMETIIKLNDRLNKAEIQMLAESILERGGTIGTLMFADLLAKDSKILQRFELSFIRRVDEASKKAREELIASGKSPLEKLIEESKG